MVTAKRIVVGLALALLLLLLSPFILLYGIYRVVLHLCVVVFWLRRGKRILFVYSDSPNWKDYIEANILPRISEQAVVLNWSERKQWERGFSLRARCFHAYGHDRDFNPMAVVFRPFTKATIIRFFRAFRDYRHGHGEALREAEEQLFAMMPPVP
jgi:hypothetical protein